MKQPLFSPGLQGHNTVLEPLQGLLRCLWAICMCLTGIFSPALASAQDVDRPISSEFMKLARDHVSVVLQPGATSQHITDAEGLVFALGWKLMEDGSSEINAQSYYLSTPSSGDIPTPFQSARPGSLEGRSFDADTSVAVPDVMIFRAQGGVNGIIQEGKERLLSDDPAVRAGYAQGFKAVETMVLSLGWVALYGYGPDSVDRLKAFMEVAKTAWAPGQGDAYCEQASDECTPIADYQVAVLTYAQRLVATAGPAAPAAPAAEQFDVGASAEYVRLTREAVDDALAPNATRQDIIRAEGLLFGVGWMALYGNSGEQVFMQKWYLAMPAGGPDLSRVDSLREIPKYNLDTTVSVSPEYHALVRERVDLAIAGTSEPNDFWLGEGSVIALGWMALYGNDAESQNMTRRLERAAENALASASETYSGVIGAGFGEMLNLHRFAMPAHSPDPRPAQVADQPAQATDQIDNRQAPAQQQWPMRVTGTGTVTAQGETREATFEILGDDQQARLIKMDAGGVLFEIAVDESQSGSSTGTGQFSPCEGGDCPCNMSGTEIEASGTCTNRAKPEDGELQFTMRIDGPPVAQQWASLASGPGEVTAQGETRAAKFEILGDDEQAWLVRIDTEGMAFEVAVAEADVGGSVGRGQLSPCDGGDCPCTMTEIEGGIEGSCSNRAYPEHGDMRFTMGRAGQQSPPIPPVPVVLPPTQQKVPVSARLRLQSDRIPVSRSDPTYTQQGLDLFPAIYLDVSFSDGTTVGPHDYHNQFAGNVIFDDVTGDPNDIIQVSYWDLDSNRPDLGKYAAQLTSTGKGVGSATLKVSLRDTPGVTASVPVTVVGKPPRQAAPVPVVPPPSTIQNQTPKKVPVAIDLELQSTTILTRTSYFQETYNGPGHVDPAIYIYVTFSDGTRMGPHDYQRQFAGNLVFDDTSGDPNDLIHVSYWDLNKKQPPSNTPGPGRFAAQLSAPGYGTGNATLKVSLRGTPGVTASIPVTVVGAPERIAAPPPVVTPPPAPPPTQAQPQLTLMTNGSGDFNDAGAEFGIWGLNGEASEIRIQPGSGIKVFTIDQNSSDEDKLRGRLTPCPGGGCSCEMFEEGQNYYMGFCDVAGSQNQYSFSFRIN